MFRGCDSLVTINIPENVETIEMAAFMDCLSLQNVNFEGNKVTKIHAWAFQRCNSLQTITLPTSITELGDVHPTAGLIGAFDSCAGLTTVYMTSTVASNLGENFGENSNFQGCPNTVTIIQI